MSGSSLTAPGIQTPKNNSGSVLSWRHVTYFLGVPLVIAIYAGLNNWQMQDVAGFPATILFYLAHSLLPWWLTCTVTYLWMKGLERFKPPWLVLLLLGHISSCLLVLPYSNWLTGIYAFKWPGLNIGPEFGPLLSGAFWGYLLSAGIIWIGINFAFDRFVDLPLYRYTIPRGYDDTADGSTPDPAQPNTNQATQTTLQNDWGIKPPAFLERLPARLQPEELLAIKAEQHYIRIFTPTREYMLLYRFSDAIRELDRNMGTQVHRSYWVNTGVVESVHTRAKNFHLRLVGGTKIPVSIPYQGMVRDLARGKHWTMRG